MLLRVPEQGCGCDGFGGYCGCQSNSVTQLGNSQTPHLREMDKPIAMIVARSNEIRGKTDLEKMQNW